MKISNCCSQISSVQEQDIGICPDCKEHCEFIEECILSPDCKCEDCKEQSELNNYAENYA